MTILVTTDGSDRSLRVLPHARVLSRALGVPVMLAHALEEPACTGEPGTLGLWQDRLAGFLATTETEGSPLVIQRAADEGISDAILRAAHQVEAKLIAMDSGGSSLLRHTLLGSVALDVVRRASVGVLVTGPAAQPPRDVESYRIVVTTDGSAASASIVGALQPLLSVRGALSLVLLRIYVPTLGDCGERAETAACIEQVRRFRNLFPSAVDIEIKVERVAEFTLVSTALVDEAESAGGSVIAMATQGYSALHHLLAGSTALAVLQRSPLPVILAGAGVHGG